MTIVTLSVAEMSNNRVQKTAKEDGSNEPQCRTGKTQAKGLS